MHKMSVLHNPKKIIVTLGLTVVPKTKIHAKKVKRLDKLPALHQATWYIYKSKMVDVLIWKNIQYC